jgi:hypothetical protein
MKGQRNSALAFFLALISLASACHKSSSPDPAPPPVIQRSTPGQVLQISREAVRKRDAARFKSVLSQKTLASLAEQAPTAEAAIEAMLEPMPGQDGEPAPVETRNERIEGSAATVEARYGDGSWRTEFFVLEDGGWKLHLFRGNPNTHVALISLADALKNREVMFFKALASGRLMSETLQKAAREGKPPDAAITELMEEMARMLPENIREYSDSKAEGDRATFTYEESKAELQIVTCTLVKEENGWKLESLVRRPMYAEREGPMMRIEVPPELVLPDLIREPKPRRPSRGRAR